MIKEDRPGYLGSLFALLKMRPRQAEMLSPEGLPYRTRDDFLSPAEYSLYRLLSSSLYGRASVFPKVRLADVFFVARPNENLSFINRVAQRHVDFLLCDPNSLRPVAGIELDDSSHTRRGRQVSRQVPRRRVRFGKPPACQDPSAGRLHRRAALCLPRGHRFAGIDYTTLHAGGCLRHAGLPEVRDTHGCSLGRSRPTQGQAFLWLSQFPTMQGNHRN